MVLNTITKRTRTIRYYHDNTCNRRVKRGEEVFGIDNINDYYSRDLKRERLKSLEKKEGFMFHQLDLADEMAVRGLISSCNKVVHLAAQAGVRYSIENPRAYIDSNIVGHFNVLNACQKHGTDHLVYASSSSVYGGNTDIPFSTTDRVDNPVSLYAATKRSNELISQSFSNIYGVQQTGLRFFTVYGPLGRPDMAYYSFTKDILEGRSIKVFNNGEMKRDFTYIDDIVSGILTALDLEHNEHRVYNLGNNRSETLMDFISTIEEATGVEAKKEFLPMQPGDVKETFADIDSSIADLGYKPKTTIAKGIPRFVKWFRKYHKI